MDKIRVLIVDDSAIIRQFLTKVLDADAGIEVVGTAMDPVFAIEKIIKNKPDVITLDVEMPRMDGLTFLQKLMASNPIPVVMFSSHTRKGAETTIRALELGAVDFVAKPETGGAASLEYLSREIVEKVKNAARANLSQYQKRSFVTGTEDGEPAKGTVKTDKIILIGASTGGVSAVKQIIGALPLLNTSIIVALHMPPFFTHSFASSLNAMTPYSAKEAEDGEGIKKNHIYVALGGKNLLIERKADGIALKIAEPEPGDFYKPCINKAFNSAARVLGNKMVAVLLTGMGDDGARGLLSIKNCGSRTIAQDRETSVVFGMPKSAIELGAAEYVEPLGSIAKRIAQLAGQ